ncbi:MAG TPA: haloacid dehalogenase-like hydrolase [Candidatus Hypogeohydataceae bacterium YC41]
MRQGKFIVFDLDGVIFRDHYLLRLSRNQGLYSYLRTYHLCILFDLGRLSIERVLEEVYKALRGTSLNTLWKVYKEMTLIAGIKEVIQKLKERGHTVAIISSGVPDFLVRDLAFKLGADMGFGIDVGFSGDSLSGTVGRDLSTSTGKAALIKELTRQRDIGWEEVVVIADDPNNISIMEQAGLSIGVNAGLLVRKKADYLIDGKDLRELLNYIDGGEVADQKREFLQELRRKLVHIWAGAVPFFANVAFSPTVIFLTLLLVLYALSELGRLNGRPVPLFGSVTTACMRIDERRSLVTGPITMALGVIMSLLLFPAHVALVVIWILAFADSAATIVGKVWKGRPLPYNRSKSVVGTLAFFLVACFCSFLCLSPIPALSVALVSSFLESLPLRDDNISLPLGSGIVLMFLGA